MKRSTYIWVAVLTLAAMVIAVGPVIWASNLGVRTMFNAPLNWIPRDSPSRREFNQFLDDFQCHEMVLISWPGCTVDDRRLADVSTAIAKLRSERAAAGEPELFSQVVSGYSLLRTLQKEPLELSPAEALQRMKGTLVGPDGRTSCAVIALTEQGALERRNALALIVDTVEDVTGCGERDLRVAGPSVDGVASDDECFRSLQHYSLPAILISLALCCVCLRSVWLTLPILAVGALGQAAMLAMVYFLGITMNAVLIMLPALVFVLTVSAGVHLVNYFLDEVSTGRVEGATTRALRRGWAPCTLAAVTTAVGLASLMVSDVRPVRQFGALAAVGVLLTVLLLFCLLPGAMEVWPRRARARSQARDSSRTRVSPGQASVWETAATTVSRRAGSITLISFLLLAATGTGIARLRSSVNPVSLLSPHTRTVRDFRWFEEHVGPLLPIEVVISFDDSCPLAPLKRMEFVASAQREISKIDILEGATSATLFFPEIPRAGGVRNTARRAVLRKHLLDSEEDLAAAQYVRDRGEQQLWRISARIRGQEDFDYARFLDEVRDQVTPLIDQYNQAGIHGINATCTGVTAVVYEVEEALLHDLFVSFLTALGCVTIIMMIALGSLRAGLIAMVPNVFPTLVVFGSMGWLGQAVDIGTVMTASVALGIAVDGTFHFLKWFRHEVAMGRTRAAAVSYAYRHCGRALTQTTVICTLGLMVFALSSFLPVRHFTVMMLLLLVAALIGDLVILPALLVGPLGGFFTRRQSLEVGQHHPRSAADC